MEWFIGLVNNQCSIDIEAKHLGEKNWASPNIKVS